MTQSLFPRKAGILLHPTCLPNTQGIGTFGDEARQFLDFLSLSGQGLWQVCPLGPTGYGDSPYQCFSAFAGNPLLIDVTRFQKTGWITSEDLKQLSKLPADHVDFGALIPAKHEVLRKAFRGFQKETKTSSWNGKSLNARFLNFINRNKSWLLDYATFMALKDSFDGAGWAHWPEEIRNRDPKAISEFRLNSSSEIAYHEFLQMFFFEQWTELMAYAHQRGIAVIGDMPIFVALDSADTWSNHDLFKLDKQGRPTHVAGVPPDYFSATGQLWGNPLYNWDRHREQNFSWWVSVIGSKLAMYDYLRIDHFRGFAAYWAVPFTEATAVHGEWKPAPGIELFQTVREKLGPAPIIAEDLGVITPDVVELIQSTGFPGMKVLQFAFDSGEENGMSPHNCAANSIMYTGTHDNDTSTGWFQSVSEDIQAYVMAYLKSPNASNIHWDFIQQALASVSCFAIVPFQDILGLGPEARMNRPGSLGGNWVWRYSDNDLKAEAASRLHDLSKLYGRI